MRPRRAMMPCAMSWCVCGVAAVSVPNWMSLVIHIPWVFIVTIVRVVAFSAVVVSSAPSAVLHTAVIGLILSAAPAALLGSPLPTLVNALSGLLSWARKWVRVVTV